MKPIFPVMRVPSFLFGTVVIGFMGMSVAQASGSTTVEETSGFSLPPLTAVDASKRGEWERLGEEADRLLSDRSFVENWRAQASFRTPAGARRALAEADDRLKEIDHAVQKKSGACLYTFFVNRCIKDARKTSYQRKREIRNLMSDARAVLHGEEVMERKKARLARDAEKNKAPTKITPKKIDTEPKIPVRIAPKEVRALSLPKPRSSVTPEEASLPSTPKGATIESNNENVDRDAMRKALEEANLAAQAQREEQRSLRQQKADEKAKARKARREAKRRKLEETMAQREEAQRRLEEERKNGKQSGFSDYL